jgi:UDP-glucuronate 4-epimerase
MRHHPGRSAPTGNGAFSVDRNVDYPVIDRPPAQVDSALGSGLDPAKSAAPWRPFTTSETTARSKFHTWSNCWNASLVTKTELVPMQPGDVPETYADVDDLMRQIGFRPPAPIEQGVNRFVS